MHAISWPARRSILNTVKPAEFANGLAPLLDASRLCGSNGRAASVVASDTAGGVVATIPVGTRPWGVGIAAGE